MIGILDTDNAVMEIITDWAESYILQTAADVVIASFQSANEQVQTVYQIEGAEYTAVMDDVVCPVCEALDGMTVNLSTPEGQELYWKYSPAQHRACRCMWIDYMADDPNMPRPEDNGRFEKDFISRFNEIAKPEDPMGLAEIAASGMHWNVNWTGYNGRNPWEKELPQIEKIWAERKRRRADQNWKSFYDVVTEHLSDAA